MAQQMQPRQRRIGQLVQQNRPRILIGTNAIQRNPRSETRKKHIKTVDSVIHHNRLSRCTEAARAGEVVSDRKSVHN